MRPVAGILFPITLVLLWNSLCCAETRCAERDPQRRKDRGIEVNGPALNGTWLSQEEYVSKDGFEPNGSALRVVLLSAGVTLKSGTRLSNVRIRGTTLEGGKLKGKEFVGAVLEGVGTDDQPVRIRIDGIVPAPDPKEQTPDNENADVLLYSVSYQQLSSGDGRKRTPARTSDWMPLCPKGEAAIAVAGRWDYYQGRPYDGCKLSTADTELTLACRRSAIAKCVERLGYKPWKPAPRSSGPKTSLDELHQACVRAIRADYCGNGEPITREGQSINFYDAVGIQADTTDWEFEAEWNPDGARCVNHTRFLRVPGKPRTQVRDYIQKRCKATLSRAGEPCLAGSGTAPAILWTEAGPSPSPPPR